jgi:hypothetical protein
LVPVPPQGLIPSGDVEFKDPFEDSHQPVKG